MEKKKLLLVAVSVGVVLLILIGIPLMVINPRQPTQPPPTWHAVPPQANDGFARPVPPVPAEHIPNWAQEPITEAPVIPAIPVETPQPPVPVRPPVTQEDDTPRVTTITVPAPRAAAVPDTPAVAARPAPARPAPAPAARPPATATRPPAAVAPRPAPPAAAVATRNNFWVQTGAFSSKVRAEIVKESLEAKGIASIIENRNINGRTWYRVRVGPYLSETEANYWLALVRSIDGFADSQVRVSQAPLN